MSSPSRDTTRPDAGASDPGDDTARPELPHDAPFDVGPFVFQTVQPTFDATLRKLKGSLSRRSIDIDLNTLGEAMREVVQDSSGLSAEPLTAGERDFLLEHTDLEPRDLSSPNRDGTRAAILRSRAAADELVHEHSLSTAEVTELTNRPGPSIRRSARLGDLYVLNPGDSRGLRFPRWQFVGTQVVPGIARLITALPEGTHPLVIERFMTGTRESLDGRSPVDWLATGGDVQKVVQLADDKGRE